MDYELTLKLKEAGLQIEHTFIDCEPCHCGVLIKRRQEFHIPTLEELIEACGEEIDLLVRITMGWKASGTRNTDGDEHPTIREDAFGVTPTIAVANLWLALNSK